MMRVRRRVQAVLVHEPGSVEDLHRLVRVECRDDLRDRAEVPVDELAEPAVVVGRARDEQLEVRGAEGVLGVDREQRDPRASRHAPARGACSLAQSSASIARSSYGTRQHLLDPARVPVGRKGKLHAISVLMPSRVAADAWQDGSCLADARHRPGCSHLAADRLLRHPGPADLADDPADAAREAEPDRARLGGVGQVHGRGRRRGGEGRAPGGRRLPPRTEEVREARRARAEGAAALRPARHRQDPAGEGGRARVGRELLLAERLRVRRDVRGPRRLAHPQALRHRP